MNRNIAVIGTAFDENHKHRLEAAAQATGCTISYYPDNDAAFDVAANAIKEIISSL